MPTSDSRNAAASDTAPPNASRDWAESGVMALTGHRNGPPVLPPGRAATLARKLSTRIAAASALGGLPVLLDGARLLSERAAFTGRGRAGRISPGGASRLLPAADGWAAVSCARPDDPLLLGALVGRDLGADPWPEVTEWVLRHPVRELAVRAELLGLAASPVTFPTAPAPFQPWFDHPVRPVSGLLVVDFSALWAGPLCAHILGLAGARVIKVETPQRPDGARRGNAGFYRLLHAGHASVVLDPGTAEGRRAMAALVEQADIVIEASRPRALAGFGLDAAAAVAAGCTWISITAHGRGSDRVGFGDDVAAGSGLVAADGDGLPLFVGDALADPLTGLAAAALAMSEPAAGGGILWDLPMSRVVAATLPAASATGSPAGSATAGSASATLDAAGRWQLRAGSDSYRVQSPQPRSPTGDASASGADTGSVLRRLGIRIP
ncbi:CoA transferase [Arthrobacter sp. AZCC_0090]|uniref:CoA transferase n=1 Tax=Arthrobacter sp. AZCC_0090 TaxID=2735881 RepID=UPI0017DF1CF5|nr:CoA transferase [Arthrobacter sp. AZCC_0090]MBB6406272.1 hypothetical protein [Arthrobacter sp. AZCC_0090]